jgi:exodeoxyribonuclease VII large subunit
MAALELMPVPVQGKDAAPAIVAMLRALSRARRHDVVLLTRGGGSIEDLWAFNDEALARAIHASAVPVVAAIGHEIDFTIADFVADLRAATPSAAAELLVPSAAELVRRIERDRAQLASCLERRLRVLAQRVDHAQARLRNLHPRVRLRGGRDRLRGLRARLRLCHPQLRLRDRRTRLGALSDRLRRLPPARLREARLRVQELARALGAVSPLATLQRGYAILIDARSGRIVRSRLQAPAGTRLHARVADGEFDVDVIDAATAAGTPPTT